MFDFDHCDRMAHDRMNLFLSNNGRVFIEYHPATSLPLPLYVKTEFVQMKTAIECYNTYIQDAFDDTEKIASGWAPVCFDEFIESEEYANMCE